MIRVIINYIVRKDIKFDTYEQVWDFLKLRYRLEATDEIKMAVQRNQELFVLPGLNKTQLQFFKEEISPVEDYQHNGY